MLRVELLRVVVEGDGRGLNQPFSTRALSSRRPEYTHRGHQSQKGRENISVAGTNRRRGERTHPSRAPIAEGEREYTRRGHQSQKGRENIPIAGTNRRRGERTFLGVREKFGRRAEFRGGTRLYQGLNGRAEP
eukprot:1966716-Pyramimonas_sp.AAC.1